MSPRNLGLTICATAMLASCGSNEPQSQVSALQTIDINRGQVFALIAPTGTTEADIVQAAKDRCEGKQWCQVMAWRDEASAPSAMPMIEREADAVVFSYLLNRSTGVEKILWNCTEFPDKPADQCTA